MNRFFFQHRDRGIPNLMLYLVLGSGMVYLLNMVNGGSIVYSMLTFDKSKILQGEVWRLVSWLFTDMLSSNPLLNIVFLFFFYRLGRMVEMSVGTLKFNLFYFSGVLLMDAFAMIFCPLQDVIIGQYLVTPQYFAQMYSQMALYLHLAMVLAYATCHPESRFYLFYFIPIPAWVMALVYLALVGVDIFNMCYPVNLLPHALFPLVGLLNYFIFFGADIPNLLPPAWRRKRRHKATPRTGTIPFPNGRDYQTKSAPKAAYTHKCTVCGRTDVTNPELEFRYCSRCNGYHCYCEDHISDHTHIE